jgi:hypothetical protein
MIPHSRLRLGNATEAPAPFWIGAPSLYTSYKSISAGALGSGMWRAMLSSARSKQTEASTFKQRAGAPQNLSCGSSGVNGPFWFLDA